MVLRLVTGITGIVATALGLTFTILGLVGPDEFLPIGIPILAVGLVDLTICAVLFRKAGEQSRRRRDGRRVSAEVVDVKLHPNIRVGVMLTVDLTVQIPSTPGGPFTRRVLLPPTFAVGAGDTIELMVDSEDPSNFEPVVTAEGRLR